MSTSVGIVLVSHSAELAAGLRLLVEQIGSDTVPSPLPVAPTTAGSAPATTSSWLPSAMPTAELAVVVLPDLGSSVLTARTVLEDHPRPDVLIVDAPFVEGAVAAVVTAASGADLKTVADAAKEARHVPKL